MKGFALPTDLSYLSAHSGAAGPQLSCEMGDPSGAADECQQEALPRLPAARA